MTEPRVVWRPDPSEAERTQLAAFQRHCAAQTGRTFVDWGAFHRWSVEQYRTFWSLFVDWAEVRYVGDCRTVCDSDEVEHARFFPDMRLSFTEHLLDGRAAPDEAIAIVECHEDGPPLQVTRGELRARVAALARALVVLGVRPGDRVVAMTAHDADTVVVALAAIGLGATWSSCGPELAADAILARFTQLDPVLLVATRSVRMDGAHRDLLERAREVAAGLPSLRATMLTGRPTEGAGRDHAARETPDQLAGWPQPVVTLESLLASPDAIDVGTGREWPRFAFDHPLYVLYSSGTTGPPKAIVHGVGGTLLEHLKEHLLHGDLRATDRLYFHTSCGWMMWHWTLSALGTGASIVTYDGSVSVPGADALWRLASETRTTVLGASPAFVQYCRDAGVRPRAHDLSSLRAMLSTGSILDERHFDWVADNVGPLPLQSISGGTDIIGCFVLGNPGLPVWRGESQCVSLAMDVRALEDPAGGPAELTCARPFPSRPVEFLHDPDRRRIHESYFARNPGRWTHGDFVELTARGSARILGRSDGVLKVRGIRIGPAEVTGVAQDFPEVREAMAVEQRAPREPGGSRIVLLVVLAPGVALDRALMHRLKRAIRDRRSADHVPSVIAAVPELPMTVNGKRSERAAREAIENRPVSNEGALRNPELLAILRTLPELHVD